MFTFAAWANDLVLGLGLEAKGTSGSPFWSWAGLEIVEAAAAEEGQIAAGFEAVLAVIALGAGVVATTRHKVQRLHNEQIS